MQLFSSMVASVGEQSRVSVTGSQSSATFAEFDQLVKDRGMVSEFSPHLAPKSAYYCGVYCTPRAVSSSCKEDRRLSLIREKFREEIISRAE